MEILVPYARKVPTHPPYVIAQLRLILYKVTTNVFDMISLVAEFAQMDRKAYVSHSDLDVRPSKINRQQLLCNLDEHRLCWSAIFILTLFYSEKHMTYFL